MWQATSGCSRHSVSCRECRSVGVHRSGYEMLSFPGLVKTHQPAQICTVHCNNGLAPSYRQSHAYEDVRVAGGDGVGQWGGCTDVRGGCGGRARVMAVRADLAAVWRRRLALR